MTRVPQERRDDMTCAMDEYEAEGHLAVPATIDVLRDLLADLADADDEQERLTAALRLAQVRAADAETEARLLAAKVERVADEVARIADESQHEGWDSPCVRSIVGRIRRALDESEADR